MKGVDHISFSKDYLRPLLHLAENLFFVSTQEYLDSRGVSDFYYVYQVCITIFSQE